MSSGMAAFLFSDDSLEVRYDGGGRLCLSPCATHFLYERPLTPDAHPLQTPDTARHRTEYATSCCRDKVLQALNFRNTFSCRPFLPSSLIPSDQKIRLLEELSVVTWPSMGRDAECFARLEDGTVRISSLDGHAHLYMPALQKEFTVEFLCQLSSSIPRGAPKSLGKDNPAGDERKPTRNRPQAKRKSQYFSSILQEDSPSGVPTHGFEYTWVVQRHSTACCPQTFHYPMSLALQFHQQSTQQSHVCSSINNSEGLDFGDSSKYLEQRSILPQALPLTCPAAHLHRWNFSAPFENDDFPSSHPLPLKVVFYNGILYRYNLEGSPSVEVHPGDGSIFLSDGDGMGKYFKHHFLARETREIEERLYTVRDLPPDKPRALYSVSSVISQARRYFELCCIKKLSLNSFSYLPCWKVGSDTCAQIAAPVMLEQSFLPDTGKVAVYSNNMVLASFLDGVLLFMIWSFANFNREEDNEVTESIIDVTTSRADKHEYLAWGRLQFPGGASKLVELENPGEYSHYIRPIVAWCKWLDGKSQRSQCAPPATQCWSVEAELKKIQRFHYLLENGGTGRSADSGESLERGMDERDIQAALHRTSQAIQEIDSLLSSRK